MEKAEVLVLMPLPHASCDGFAKWVAVQERLREPDASEVSRPLVFSRLRS